MQAADSDAATARILSQKRRKNPHGNFTERLSHSVRTTWRDTRFSRPRWCRTCSNFYTGSRCKEWGTTRRHTPFGRFFSWAYFHQIFVTLFHSFIHMWSYLFQWRIS
jgi:hypothetical protein